MDSMVGLLLNTTPVRVRVERDRPVVEWLAGLQDEQVRARGYEHTPLVTIAEASELPPGQALFNTLFVFENYPDQTLTDSRELSAASGLGTGLNHVRQQASYPLSITAGSGRELMIKVSYDRSQYDSATVERLAGHLVNVLESIAEDAGRRVGELPVLGAGERQRVVEEWNEGVAALPGVGGVHELIAGQAHVGPDAVAVVSDGVVLTYGGLMARANRLAHHLRGLGVGAESVVGLCLPRGVDMVVAMVAVWQAGAAYLPLDPDYPFERLEFMLADSGARVLIGHSSVAEVAEVAGGLPVESVVWLDDPAVTEGLPSTAPEVSVQPDQLAYVIYTSGSTGRPKGVQVAHRGVTGMVTGLSPVLGAGPGVRVLQFASFSFDAAVLDVAVTLASGGTLVVASSAERTAPEALTSMIGAQAVGAASVVPSLLGVLNPDEVPGIQTLLLGAERLTQPVAQAWAQNRTLVNTYGPTEATVMVTTGAVAPDVAAAPPIGAPVANARLYVLDARLNPVPVGVAGEVFIAGPQVARGYRAQPALTAERFLPDPFATDGTRMYRSGDRARWLADGTLDFIGRTDAQVKVRGFRIEPGEIEAVLAAHPQIRTAVVTAFGDTEDRKLVAHLVPADQTDGIPSTPDLRTFAGSRLPAFMIPATFIELATLPLTPNGKLDRSALPLPDGTARTGAAGEYVAPRTEAERILAEVWAQVLGVERVGIEENFFDLGGDSIISIRVAAKSREFGVHVTVAQLFEHQTVAGLASVAAATSAVLAEQGRVVADFVPTPVQQQFLARELPHPAHFNQSMVLEVGRPVDPELLRAALAALVEHHDVLRSRFVREEDGAWAGRVEAVETADLLTLIDASGAGVGAEDAEEGNTEEAFLEARATDVQADLDLSDGPLLRAALIERGEEGDQGDQGDEADQGERGDRVDQGGRGQLVLLVIHHLVVDAVSWPILLEDLTSAYEQVERGTARVELPAKTTSFPRWAQRLGELAASPEVTAEAGYWQKIEGAAVRLPRDHKGPNRNASVRNTRTTLGAEHTERLLREVPSAFRTQINDVLLSVLGAVLTEWTGTASVVVDVEGHGREDVGADIDVSRTVGWFTSVHPVALTGADDGDLGALLRRTKENLRAVPRNGLGHGLLRHLTDRTPPGEAPTAEVSFNYLGRSSHQSPHRPADTRNPGPDRALFGPSGRSLGESQSADGTRAHLIEVNSQVADGSLEMEWTYSCEVHDEATVRRLAQRYVDVLADLIEYCCRPEITGHTPSDFPLARLDQDALDLITGGIPTVIEDIHPLTAVQQGMLFHTRLATEPGMYWAQNGVLLEGRLDLDALKQAWELVFARHEVLRSAVVWEGVPEPLAVVSRSVPLPLHVLDLSHLDEEARRHAVTEHLEADWERGADFSAPTLVRISLIRLADDRHQLVWSFHHLLLDGWSVPIVLNEVLEAYQALREGNRPRLAARAPFRDFVAWAVGQDANEAREHWRERLAGMSEPTTLGLEHATGNQGRDERRVPLPAPVSTSGLAEFARRHRLTLNTVVQGAWALVLGLYAGSDDILFGVTSSGRGGQIDGMDEMVGLLINTTPVRVSIDRHRPVADWLSALQDEQVRDRKYEHTPLVTIAECSQLPSGQALFDTVFAFENYPDQALVEGGQAGRYTGEDDCLRAGTNYGRDQSNYPLGVIASSAQELVVRLSYDRAHYDDAAVERLAGHLGTVLEAIAADTGQYVGDLPVLTADEHDRLLREWNDTAVALPAESGVHELIAAHADLSGDAVAVVAGERSLTYDGLLLRANRLAQRLRRAGVGPESVVALCLERGVDLAVAVLAVWQAGAAYLPLDPEYPSERLEFMLGDSGAKVLIGHRSMAADLVAHTAPETVVWLDDRDTRTGLAALPDIPPPGRVLPDQLAYVIYTSGSTGLPKGVHLSHRGLVSLATAQRSALGTGRDDVVLGFAPFSFDASVWELVMALAVGATLVVAEAPERSDAERLASLVVRAGVSVATVPPSLLDVLRPGDLDGMTTLVTAGERLDGTLAAAWSDHHRLLNAYGPTESTVCASIAPIGAAQPHAVPGAPPIGAPIAGTRVFVLDAFMKPVPVGVPGELFIAGPQLARGYGGRPALSAERFVADPFAGDGSRLYRTGDRVRWLADGQLDFLGRADEQVKVRGYRIEPAEIESALGTHPGVRTAVVTASGDGGDRRLVAYLVPADPAEGAPAAAELRAFAGERLPSFMVPSVFVELAALPLTPNGKTDRAALPEPDGIRAGSGSGYVAPGTATEELLAGVWERVLGVDRVGATDGFFELGGHSLLAGQVVSRVREILAVELPLSALFDRPTVRGLAAVIDSSARDAAPPVTAVARDETLPLSFAQQRLWFLDQLEPGSPEYNMSTRVHLTGEVDLPALGAALDAIVARHEVLRTRLVAGPDGVAHQVIDPPTGLPLPVVDVSGCVRPQDEADRLFAKDGLTPFDLARGPLVRATLVRLAPDEHVLALAMHHVVFDEWSDRVLRRELSALYEAFRAGEPNPLEPLAVQYADVAAWQRQWLSGDVLDGQLSYWTAQLAQAPVLELPTDRPRPLVRSTEGAIARFTVATGTAEALRALSREHGSTMFMTLLAAFNVLLGRYGDTDDVALGTPVANRTLAETEDLIGFFVNTLVMRTDLSDNPSFTELLGRVRETALGAYAHQDLPFDRLVDALVTERDRSRTPLYDVMFSYVPEEPGAAGGTDGGTASGDAAVEAGTGGDPEQIPVKFDLVLTLADENGSLTGELQYSSALFDATTAQRMTGHLVTLFDAVAAAPDRHIGELPMVTPAEHRQLVHEWNDTAADLPPTGGLHKLIAAQAAATPDVVAVMSGEHTLTYGALLARASRLAHHLRQTGVGPESVVALCLERGADMAVATLAVWLAGAGYLPLDPAYPLERLQFMVADSGASVLLGHETVAAGLTADTSPATVLWLDDPATWTGLSAMPATPPRTSVLPDQLAYIIYTSGSTGRPKGVHVPHRGVTTLAEAMRPLLHAGPGDHVLGFASFSFDASVWEVVMALPTGATLVVAEAQDRTPPERLTSLMRRSAVSLSFMTPSVLEVLVPDELPDLATVLVGGERVEAALTERWRERLRLLNVYGPTETTIATTAGEVETDGTPPIGTPYVNERVHVLDQWLNPVPVGVAGELFIGGSGVTRGYGGRGALTAERFLADPFAADGSRMYRSGDRARRLADGRLEFIGRADNQVKVRGFRIEPGEIETVLAAHPGVRTAVVTAYGTGTERKLVAYLVPADMAEGMPPVAELRAFVGEHLPKFMVPAVFTEMAGMPMTRSGKIDRGALPAPDGTRAVAASTYVAPRTDVERILADAWAQVLGLDRVGVEDNFFDLGGDSIISIRVVARAREFGVHVTAAQLFDHQTVASLASVASGESVADAEQGLVSGAFQLTPIQHWYLERELPDPSHFNQSVVLEAVGRVDTDALRAAAHAVVEQHDALRSRFVRDADGVWTGRVSATEPADLVTVIDAPAADDTTDGAEDYLEARATEVQAALDLHDGPLLRLALFDRGERGQLVLLVVHHLAVDAVSWPILLEDLTSAYEQAARGATTVELPAKTTSFQRWSQRLGELAASPEVTDEAAYWQEIETSATPLPRDRDGHNSVASARDVVTALGAEQTERLLREVPSAFRTQINDVLLTALGMVLAPWARVPSVVVDLEGHGREDVGADIDVSRTVGWFTSMYPVALTGARDGDLGAALRRTKEYLRAVPRKGLGHGMLRHLTDRLPRTGPAPEVSFNYLSQRDRRTGTHESATGAPGAAGGPGASGGETGPFRPGRGSLGRAWSEAGDRAHLIDVNCRVADGRLEMVWTYGSEVHDEATVQRLAQRYADVLIDLIEYCCEPDVHGNTPSDFPLARVDQQTLDRVGRQLPTTIDDIYPLTALQQGMLFHTQLSADPGMYWVQNGMLLEGELDLDALKRACELVFARHEVLRTTVVWDGVPEPLAVVSRTVPLPFEDLDLSHLDEEVRQRAIEDHLSADWARGADFSAPTLVRLALIRLADDRHQLVWSYHHLLLDGWSLPIVMGEMLEAYQALRRGSVPDLAPRASFRDFIAWTTAQDGDEARAYWRERLSGITGTTSLGVAHATGDSGRDEREVSLSSTEAAAGLAEFARRHRLTVNTVVQGACALVLGLYADSDDVVFGVTSSGRGDQIDGMAEMVGLLINTTPVRVRVDRDRPVTDWLAELQDEQVRAREYEHTSLVTITECSELPPGQALFDTLFVFENYPDQTLAASRENSAADGLEAGLDYGREQVNYPLHITAGLGRELRVKLSYDRARLDAGTVERMAGHLATVLEAIAEDGGRRVGELPVLTAVERDRLLREWNDTAAPLPSAGGAHELIAGRARATPDAVAVVSGDVSLTYGGLTVRANRLARHLRQAGVSSESVVALCLPRGVDMVVAALAVWQTGGAYLPLDPEFPQERLEFMLADSGASVLVGHRSVAAALVAGTHVESVVWLDDPSTGTVLDTQSPAPLEVDVDAAQLAYVLYTSGSTGRPKGVQVSHANLIGFLSAMAERPGLDGGDVLLAVTTLGFDIAGLELWLPLVSGARVVVAGGEVAGVPAALAGELVRVGATVMQATPATWQMLVSDGWDGVPGLRVLCGGEALPASLAATLVERTAGVWNMYGPTETTIWSACEPVAGAVPGIGAPIANTRVYVLDERLAPVPVGVPGELFIGGAGVTRGYLGRRALTAERFVADPFAADGGRLYRTGDRVRWLADGRLEFLGRADDQLKVRGFRIEPGEIEFALALHPQIGSAVVSAHGEGAERRLVAYLVAGEEGGTTPPPGELREHVRQTLPEYMVPSLFMELPTLPLTPNGKINRFALPEPEGPRPESRYVAPVTTTEELLAGIWAQVLGADRVGVTDGFFDLGGHSLLAAQVISRIREAFRVEIPLATLFDAPTVRELAAAVDGAGRDDVLPPIVNADRTQALPLSFAQQRLWFLDQLEPGSVEYNLPTPMRWRHAVDVDALAAALSAVVARHEVLRTRLTAGADGAAYQVIDPPSEFALPVVDVSGSKNPTVITRELLSADAVTPFDLANGPMIRATLIRLAQDEHVLALSTHHVVSDEWSDRILQRELLALYEAFRAGEPDPLPPLSVQYADFALWQRAWLTGEVLERQLDYWRQELAGVPVLELPTDRPRPPVRSTEGAVHRFSVPDRTAEALRALSGRSGTTMSMTLLAAFSVLLGRYAGSEDVVVGTPVANRNRAETEDLIGFFVNTLVMRTDLSGDPSFGDVLGRVRGTALGAYGHQDVPFEQLVDDLVVERDRSRTPLFQVLYTYAAAALDDVHHEETGAEPDAGPGRNSGPLPVKYDLMLALAESGDALTAELQFSTALFDAVTVERMAGHLVRLLEAVAVDADQRV
ncbi:non-ribosomal peptide synthase/polyketide synthase, partial [Streptomyces sp. SD11]|uniref:non-ribosomal peptide synthase/polyketide synthase n=1 Tax=Streptomyces sp. SD11 TaxID=3452209 RepID=UPI003F8A1FB2